MDSVSNDQNVNDGIIQIIKDVFQSYHRRLSEVIDGSLPDFANRMHEESLTTNIKDSFDPIMEQYLALFPFLKTFESIEELCRKILNVLFKLGGPLITVSATLKDEISTKVEQKFQLSFLKSDPNVTELKHSTPRNVGASTFNRQTCSDSRSDQYPQTTATNTNTAHTTEVSEQQQDSYTTTGHEERNTPHFTFPSSSYIPGAKTIINSAPLQDSGFVSKTHTPSTPLTGHGAGDGKLPYQPTSDPVNGTYNSYQTSGDFSSTKHFRDHLLPTANVEFVLHFLKEINHDEREERRKAESRANSESEKRREEKDLVIKDLKREVIDLKDEKKKLTEDNENLRDDNKNLRDENKDLREENRLLNNELRQEQTERSSVLKELDRSLSDQQDLATQLKVQKNRRKQNKRKRLLGKENKTI